MNNLRFLAGMVLLTACNPEPDGASDGKAAIPAAVVDRSLQFEPRPDAARSLPAVTRVFAAQVALDRLGFSPRLIDGRDGPAFKAALQGFQRAHDLPETGRLDDRTREALARFQNVPAAVLVAIPKAFAQGPFVSDLPHELTAQAKFRHLGYRSMTEALAERFHTSPEMLVALNGEGTYLAPGRTVRVPNVANVYPSTRDEDMRGWNRTLQLLGVSPRQPSTESIVVDRSDGLLRVFGKENRLVAQFLVTTGSSHDPLPIGTWKINGVARNPDYQYNPDLFWDASDNERATRLPPGPNGPVGVVWIDLSKAHYGIHGTPEPQNIGRTESHGCVRLTNWDAARLAQMVSPGTEVIFQP